MNLLLCLALVSFAAADEVPFYEAEQIFQPVEPQTHAPGIVETANGDLLASWYGGSEGPESDAGILGARKRKGESAWSKPFMMADRPGFPDCNTCMMIDGKRRLWLFWPTVIGDSWESCLMNYRTSTDYDQPGAPKWDRESIILLKPANFRDEALKLLGDRKLRPPRGAKGGPDEQCASSTTRSTSGSVGRRAASQPFCPAVGSCCRSIPTRLPFRSWRSATTRAAPGMPANR